MYESIISCVFKDNIVNEFIFGVFRFLVSIMNCGACTFENPPNTTICEMCSKSIKPIESNISENWNGIQCDACTFLNHSDADICECCGSDIYVDGEEENIFVSQHEVEEQLIDVASNTKVC